MRLVPALVFLLDLIRALDCASPSGCDRPPAAESTWHAKGMDEYLQTYPKADSLTFQSGYLPQLRINDFRCGWRKKCDLSKEERCNPLINDFDWLVLQSVSNWNHYVNSLSSELNRIGSDLAKSILTETSKSLHERPTRRFHLRKRSMSKTTQDLKDGMKVLPPENQAKFSIAPTEIGDRIEKPLAQILVPESQNLRPIELPPLWVRLFRYIKESTRKLHAKVKGRRKQPIEGVPYYPNDLSIPKGSSEKKEIVELHKKAKELLQKWYSSFAKSRSKEKISENPPKESSQELLHYDLEWEKLDKETFRLVDAAIRKESEEVLSDYRANVHINEMTKGPQENFTLDPSKVDKARLSKTQSKALTQVEKAQARQAEAKEKLAVVQKETMEEFGKGTKRSVLTASKLNFPKELPVLKFEKESIFLPPPPTLYEPKDLLSKRSANLAYEKNLLSRSWNKLYEEAITSNNAEDEELQRQRLKKLAEIKRKSIALGEEYEIVKRLEIMQEVIDQHTTKEEAKVEKIIFKLRKMTQQTKTIRKEMMRAKDEYGEDLDKVVAHSRNADLKFFLNQVNEILSAPKEKDKFSNGLRKRSLEFDSKIDDGFVSHEEASTILKKLDHLMEENMTKILRLFSLNGTEHLQGIENYHHPGIFGIIQAARFVHQADTQSINYDLKYLVGLTLTAKLLEKHGIFVYKNLSKTCDPKVPTSFVTEREGSFCGTDGLVITVIIQGIDEEGTNSQAHIDLKSVDTFLKKNVNGSLSDIMNLAFECNDSKPEYFLDKPSYSNLSSTAAPRLTGILSCAIGLPVHYLMSSSIS